MDDDLPSDAQYSFESRVNVESTSYAGAFFPKSHHFVVKGGRFTSNVTNNNIHHAAPSLPDDFGKIPVGDVVSRVGGLFGGEGGIENLVGGFFGAKLEGIAANQLAGLADLAGKVVCEVTGAAGSAIGSEIDSILRKLFNGGTFGDLSEAEVKTLLAYVNSVSERELAIRFSIPLGVVTSALKDLGSVTLAGAAINVLDTLLRNSSSSVTTTAAATGAPSSSAVGLELDLQID
ncbi:hypothetical protein B0H11DRAFT_2293629 [Mycena galericulata]|nr:hypothetical protein B0H11DRAFT_2293629 [Mycena galericulata]